MKKKAAAILTAILALSLAGCGNSGTSRTETTKIQTNNRTDSSTGTSAVSSQTKTQAEPVSEAENETRQTVSETETAAGNETETETETQTVNSGTSNILIAYFSVMETDGVDTVGGASRVAVDGEVLGNNEYMAKLIQKETGGDLFEIKTVQNYPTTHEPLLQFAYDEKAENARPELSATIDHLDQYDTIFLGYPNWNADLPMPLYTFLEEYDFSGKTIIPFNTHGGSGFSRTISTIKSLQPNAEVLDDGLSISRNSMDKAPSQVSKWIKKLGMVN